MSYNFIPPVQAINNEFFPHSIISASKVRRAISARSRWLVITASSLGFPFSFVAYLEFGMTAVSIGGIAVFMVVILKVV
jgi:hypothetical protein